MELHQFDALPENFCEVSVRDLDSVLPGPSLIYLKGKQDPPLFVSTLLHGNEISGFLALQELLQDYRNKTLPRSMLLLVGNVKAAMHEVRSLPTQADYNRIWSGGDSDEHKFAKRVLETVAKYKPFASIDVHNNSGINPHYGCVNSFDAASINLASLYSRTLVYFTRPEEVLSNAMKEICPSITIESGVSGEVSGIEHVRSYIEDCLRIQSLEMQRVDKSNIDIYHTFGRIKVPESAIIGFGQDTAGTDINFIEDLEYLNFSPIEEDTLIGWRNNPSHTLSVTDSDGQEIGGEYFSYTNNEIRSKQALIPSMFSQRVDIIYQDCLGYLMERVDLNRVTKNK